MVTSRSRVLSLCAVGLLGCLMILGAAADSSARSYVSLRGGFFIEYPDEWWQVDYQTVDYYLNRLQADPDTYDYDAVFSARKIAPFYEYEYLILTVDTSGEMSRRERDSVVADLADLFGEHVEYRSVSEFFEQLEVDHPVYDRDRQVFVRLTDVSEEQQGGKLHLYCLRFFDRGTAHFYFFAPDSTFEHYRPQFHNILMSFSTDDVSSKVPKESASLADAKKLRKSDEGSGASGTKIAIPIAVFIVIVIVIAARRKRSEKK